MENPMRSNNQGSAFYYQQAEATKRLAAHAALPNVKANLQAAENAWRVMGQRAHERERENIDRAAKVAGKA